MHTRSVGRICLSAAMALLLSGPALAFASTGPSGPTHPSVVRLVRMARLAAVQAGKQGEVASDVLTRSVISGWTGAWGEEQEHLYFYSGSRLVEVRNQRWQAPAGPWIRDSRDVTVYSGDRITEERHETWDGASSMYRPANRTRTSYTGGNTMPSEDIYETWNGSAYVPVDRTLYTISGGFMTRLEAQNWNGSAWVPDTRDTYAEVGADLELLSEEWNGAAWVPKSKVVYSSLTFSGLMTVMQNMAADEILDFSVGRFYLLWPANTMYEWEAAAWVPKSRFRPVKDGQNRVTFVHMDSHDGSAWVEEFRYTFEYGVGNRLEASNNEMFDGSAWMVFTRDEYAYDGSGRLTQTIAKMVNFFTLALENNRRYQYQYGAGSSTAVESGELPVTAVLDSAYPNPFNPGTTIAYKLPAAGRVSIAVFDALGRRVASLVEGIVAAGEHSARFDAGNNPSGVYYVVLTAGLERSMLPVTLLR